MALRSLRLLGGWNVQGNMWMWLGHGLARIHKLNVVNTCEHLIPLEQVKAAL